MILQSLVRYYEALAEKDKITRPGWSKAKVSYGLNISAEGELLNLIFLKEEKVQGKKKVWRPSEQTVPQMVSRSSGIDSNFLCDNSTYLLGVDEKGKPKRSVDCFQEAGRKHHEILLEVHSKAAMAVLAFFDYWQPEKALEHPALTEYLEDIMKGGNLIFSFEGRFVHEDEEIVKAWMDYTSKEGLGEQKVCLVTGERAEIARTHGTLQGVQGAQSSGAALVSFNAPAFESYGKEQSLNAPVGNYAVYAYTTALSYLLSDRDHATTVGDMTIVYWSEDGEETYQDIFAAASEPKMDNAELVDGVFKNLAAQKAVAPDEVLGNLSMDQRFYVLGLAPNAARIAVRFFYQDSFGSILENIRQHYERLSIVRPSQDSVEYMGIWRLLQETANKKSRDKKPIPNMAGAVYRAVISGGRYPDSLYSAVLNRIRGEQDDSDSRIYKITRGRAAIIKAYLLRNKKCDKEEVTMALNEESSNIAYTLGREFAVLEEIQETANPGINATIKDRYFNSACATPAAIFPILFRLKNSHIRKISNVGAKVNFEKLLSELQGKLLVQEGQQTACPKRLTLEEQGMFILGYYHQTQKRYEKKVKEEN